MIRSSINSCCIKNEVIESYSNVGGDKGILVFCFGSCRAFDEVLLDLFPMKIEDYGLEARISIFFTGYDQG